MNRQMLANIIERHASIRLPGDTVTPWECLCTRRFVSEGQWAKHVVDVIYPRS